MLNKTYLIDIYNLKCLQVLTIAMKTRPTYKTIAKLSNYAGESV